MDLRTRRLPIQGIVVGVYGLKGRDEDDPLPTLVYIPIVHKGIMENPF